LEEFAASDGYRWRYRRYAEPALPRAHVVVIHVIQSHAGWYEYSCTKLSQAGFAVTFLDRRGSGMNEQARGDTPHYRRLLDDLAEFLTTLRRDKRPACPGELGQAGRLSLRPVFLVAISWGGKLAVALQRRHPGLVDGIALLCPGFFPRVKPSLRQRLAIVWARVTAPRRLFPVPLDDPALFTATPRWPQLLRD